MFVTTTNKEYCKLFVGMNEEVSHEYDAPLFSTAIKDLIRALNKFKINSFNYFDRVKFEFNTSLFMNYLINLFLSYL